MSCDSWECLYPWTFNPSLICPWATLEDRRAWPSLPTRQELQGSELPSSISSVFPASSFRGSIHLSAGPYLWADPAELQAKRALSLILTATVFLHLL
jgi:hypothetical protein